MGQNGVMATFWATATTHNPKTLWGRSYRVRDGTGPEVWCPISTGPTCDPTELKKGTEVGRNGLTAASRSTAMTHNPKTLWGRSYRIRDGMGLVQGCSVPSQLDQPVTQQDTKKGQKWDKTDSRPHFGPPQQPIDPPKKPYRAILIGSL